jgi:hypothetical protein
LVKGGSERRVSAAWMPLTRTGRSPGTTTRETVECVGGCGNDLAGSCFCPGSARRRAAPRWNVRERGRPSSQHGVTRTISYSGATGIVTDSAVPGVRRGRAPPLARRLADLRRCRCGGRIAELELAAGDPDSVHDHCQFTSDRDGCSLHAAPFTPSRAGSVRRASAPSFLVLKAMGLRPSRGEGCVRCSAPEIRVSPVFRRR